MKPVTLSTHTDDGTTLEATFLPEAGMNLISYKLGDIEVIDQSTKGDFETARNGLGPLIGPHFHERPDYLVPKIKHEFSHEKAMRESKKVDIFSHGVARYAPWNAHTKENSIHAVLSGEDTLEGIPLAEIEGQNFKMQFDAYLTSHGLKLDLSVVSDTDSVVGFHYYYSLGGGQSRVRAPVQKYFLSHSEKKSFPPEWHLDPQHWLTYPLDKETDFTFFSYPSPLNGKIILETQTHHLVTHTSCVSSENSWQLWHPKGASFACVEPVSAQDPRKPNLTVSSISSLLTIIPSP